MATKYKLPDHYKLQNLHPDLIKNFKPRPEQEKELEENWKSKILNLKGQKYCLCYKNIAIAFVGSIPVNKPKNAYRQWAWAILSIDAIKRPKSLTQTFQNLIAGKSFLIFVNSQWPIAKKWAQTIGFLPSGLKVSGYEIFIIN